MALIQTTIVDCYSTCCSETPYLAIALEKRKPINSASCTFSCSTSCDVIKYAFMDRIERDVISHYTMSGVVLKGKLHAATTGSACRSNSVQLLKT